jgi:DNA-binding NtrC family response regulator
MQHLQLLAVMAAEAEVRLEQALVLGENEFIEPEDLPEVVLARKTGKSSIRGFEARVLEFKKQIVKEAMDEARGDFVDAARIMDITEDSARRSSAGALSQRHRRLGS